MLLELAGIMGLACDWVTCRRPGWRAAWRTWYDGSIHMDVYDVPHSKAGYLDFIAVASELRGLLGDMGLTSVDVIHHYRELWDESC